MSPETKKALEGSIRKWEGIVIGTVIDNGPANCPLCKRFYAHQSCKGCPVSKATGKSCCSGSPYEAWERLPDEECGSDLSVRARRQALKMLRFLEGLRP